MKTGSCPVEAPLALTCNVQPFRGCCGRRAGGRHATCGLPSIKESTTHPPTHTHIKKLVPPFFHLEPIGHNRPPFLTTCHSLTFCPPIYADHSLSVPSSAPPCRPSFLGDEWPSLLTPVFSAKTRLPFPRQDTPHRVFGPSAPCVRSGILPPDVEEGFGPTRGARHWMGPLGPAQQPRPPPVDGGRGSPLPLLPVRSSA